MRRDEAELLADRTADVVVELEQLTATLLEVADTDAEVRDAALDELPTLLGSAALELRGYIKLLDEAEAKT
jgi:hypothetical protein